MGDFSRIDGVVKDSLTSLEWQDDYSDNNGYIKHTTWTRRLPTINELVSLVDDTRSNPAIDTIFEKITPYHYWSSSSITARLSKAWIVPFNNGAPGYNDKSTNYYVRCVRAGQ